MERRPKAFFEGKPWGLSDDTIGTLLTARAAWDGAFPYCRFEGRIVTVKEIDVVSNRIANALTGLGLRRGDRVSVMLGNSVDHIGLFFALAKLGVCEICMNVHLRGDSLAHTLRDADPAFLIAENEYREVLEPYLPSLKTRQVIWRGINAAQDGLNFSALTQFSDSSPVSSDVQPDDMTAINYTSGTTGLPKGVMLTDKMLRISAWAAARLSDAGDGDVFHMWEPFYHIGGCEVLILAVQKRITLAMVPKLSVSRLWNEVREHGCTHMHYLGGILALLLKQPATAKDKNHTLRITWGGGCPEKVWIDFEARFGTKIRDAYGMTECSSFTTQNVEGLAGSIGRALPYLDVSIVDDDGKPLGPNERGEIWIREKVPGVMSKGYWRNPQATEDAFKGGVVHTGDMGSYDEDGFFYYLGRKKDSLRRRGENISAFEVERILNQHPSVEESALIGVQNDIADEDVKAVIKLKEGQALDPLDLIKWCESRMAYFQIPRYVEFIDDFPKTPSERIRKEALSRDTEICWDLEKTGYKIKR